MLFHMGAKRATVARDECVAMMDRGAKFGCSNDRGALAACIPPKPFA